jgi:hypothetical protein
MNVSYVARPTRRKTHGQSAGNRLPLVFRKRIATPVQDKCKLPHVFFLTVAIVQGPIGRLSPSSLIAAYGKKQRGRKPRLAHRRTAAYKGVELHPAKGLPLAFPAQKPQPLRAQEEPRRFRVDSVLFG